MEALIPFAVGSVGVPVDRAQEIRAGQSGGDPISLSHVAYGSRVTAGCTRWGATSAEMGSSPLDDSPSRD